MTDTIDHIICGGAGKVIGEPSIQIYDHDVLNVAINLKHHGLQNYGVDLETALKLGKKIQKDVDGWYKELQKLGVPTSTYPPHAANLKL